MFQTVSHYRLIERLGAGGMGEVWKAEDLKLQRTVAVKFLTHGMIDDPKSKERITHEARAAAAINHPNIATVYEIGEDSGRLFIIMEFVEGQTLRSRIEQGPFELSDALDVAVQVAEALSAAHTRGLIHCDIKDSNVMTTPEGVAKVLDFGLAKTRADLATSSPAGGLPVQRDATALVPGTLNRDSDSTTEPALTGTLHYLAPEQIRGEQVNVQTDLFSLGVVLYQMLTARPPFDGDSRASVIKAILDAEPRPIGAYRDDVPLELEGAVRKALEKNPSERYATAREMRAELKAVRTNLETNMFPVARLAASPVSSEEQEQARPRRFFNRPARDRARSLVWRFRKWIAGVGAIALLAAVADFLFVQHGGGWSRDLALSVLALLCIAVASAASRRRPAGPNQARSSGAAFRGLLPFQETDRDRFYGRDVEAAALFDMIAHNDFRFGVLFGESGSGKTSLLRAGVLPKLWEAGFLPVYCRSYKDPLAALLEECRRQSQLDRRETESAADYLKRVSETLCAGIVIACDQFEEFFVNFKTKSEREPFISFVAEQYNSAATPLKFLFAMRSDFLYLVSSEFEGRVPEPLMSSRLYHLRNLDEDRAEEIIERSAQRAGLPFEPELIHQVALDLSNAGTVLPSELQIVGERLQSKRIYTVQEYRRVGGKEPLVHSFLEDVIQASGDQASAQLLLRCLISDENTRLTLSPDEIARRTQRTRQTTERVLSLFVGARLVREVQEDDPWRYELMHEYLIERINQITGRVMDATQRANRLFKQYLSNHAVDKNTRIPISKLWFIRRYSDVQRGERERELLRKSLTVGLAKAGTLALVLGLAATVAAAALSASEDWDSVRLSDGHTAAVRRAVFSPDGRLLASCGEDAKVIVWDFARRSRIATLTDHTDWVGAIAFSPDGRWLATGSEDQRVIVWDGVRFEKVAVLSEHQTPVRSLAFSPDGRLLASMSAGNMILWSVGQWQRVGEVAARGGSQDSIFFSRDSRQIINSNTAEIWDAATGKQLAVHSGWGGSGASLSPDGARVVTVDGLGNVSIIDLSRRKIIFRERAHHDNGRAAAFSPDGRLLATGAEIIILWDAATQTKLVRLEHTAIVWSVAFSPDGRWLVSTHGDGSILIWDVQERERLANLNGHSGPVRAAGFSRDGKHIVSASDDKSVIIWDAQSGRKETVLIGHATRLTGASFLPDAESLATCDLDTGARLWDTTSGWIRWSTGNLERASSGSYCLAVSPDGRFVATSQGVCESSEGRNVLDFYEALLPAGYSSVYGVAFSPDSRRMVCVSAFGLILLWDVEKWQVLSRVQMVDSAFISVSFSPDGKYIATGEDEGAARLWQVDPLEQVAIIGRHAARIKSVVFSPDGERLASASDDQTIALWDVGRRSLITYIGTHTAPVLSVAFSPDGKRLVSGEHDKSVRVFTRHRTLWGYRLD